MARYGQAAQKQVERTMRKRKRGTLRSGGSGKKVTSREQAIAIGLEEARSKGAKVPPRSSRTGTRRKSSSTRGRSTSTRSSRTRSSGSRRAAHRA